MRPHPPGVGGTPRLSRCACAFRGRPRVPLPARVHISGVGVPRRLPRLACALSSALHQATHSLWTRVPRCRPKRLSSPARTGGVRAVDTSGDGGEYRTRPCRRVVGMTTAPRAGWPAARPGRLAQGREHGAGLPIRGWLSYPAQRCSRGSSASGGGGARARLGERVPGTLRCVAGRV
jgi:hypothetical protein